MKRKERVLFAFTTCFVVLILAAAITGAHFFRNYRVYPLGTAQAIRDYLLIFDFKQWRFDIFSQYLALGLGAFGTLLSLLWFIIAVVKRPKSCIMQLLFLLFNLVTTVYISFMGLYITDYYINHNNTLDTIPLVCGIIAAADLLVLLVAFILDMVRVSVGKKVARLYEVEEDFAVQRSEADYRYQPETLFNEVYEDSESTYVNLTRAELQKLIAKKVYDRLVSRRELEEYNALREVEKLPFMEDGFEAMSDDPEASFEEIAMLIPAKEKIEYLPFMKEGFKPIVEEVVEEKQEEEYEYVDLPIFHEEVVEKPVEDNYVDLPIFHEEEAVEKPVEDNYVDLPIFHEKKRDNYVDLPIFHEERRQVEEPEPQPEPVVEELPAMFYKEERVAETPKHTATAYHISCREGEYLVKKAGEKVPVASFPTELDAIDYVRNVEPHASIRIHSRDGKIRTI